MCALQVPSSHIENTYQEISFNITFNPIYPQLYHVWYPKHVININSEMDNSHSFYQIKSLKFSVFFDIYRLSPSDPVTFPARLQGGSRMIRHFWKAPADAPGTKVSCVCVCVCARARSAARSRPTLCNRMDCSPRPRLLRPWDSPGKNIGAGSHALL